MGLPLAFAVEITWGLVSSAVGGMVVLATAASIVYVKFFGNTKKLISEAEEKAKQLIVDAASEKIRLHDETDALRSETLALYKDLYNAEKLRSTSQYAELSERVTRNADRLKEIETENDSLRKENTSLRSINLELQEKDRKNSAEIANLKSRLSAIESKLPTK